MPLPPDFASECLYAPAAWFVHDIANWDPDEQRFTGLIDTTDLGVMVESQVVRPWHPAHFPGSVAVQVTGTLGNLHAVYMAGLRVSEGWAGYGTKLSNARFRKMGTIGPPIQADCHCYRQRKLRGAWFFDYRFRYEQEGNVIYESEQSAVWTQAS